MASLFDDIKTHLKARTAVTDLVGTGDRAKIYLDWVKQGVTPPFIRIEIFDVERFPHLSAQSNIAEYRVQVDCYGANHTQATTLADAVRYEEAVDNAKGQMGHYRGLMGSSWVRSVAVDSYTYDSDPPQPGKQDPRYYVSQDYIVYYQEPST